MKKLFIFFLLLTFLHSCKEDCPVEPNLCDLFPEKFEILTSIKRYQFCNDVEYDEFAVYPYDTFRTPNAYIRFELNYSYDSVVWKVQNDPKIWRQNILNLGFSKPFGRITVQAIGYRPGNNDCFGSEDDGIDTIQRTIALLHEDDSPIFGTFRGTNDGESDSFNIVIGRDTFVGQDNLPYYENYFSGLPKNSQLKLDRFIYRWYSFYSAEEKGGISFDDLALCYTSGRLYGPFNNQIEVKWRIANNEETPRIFNGVGIK
jgi:hypothetical protein